MRPIHGSRHITGVASLPRTPRLKQLRKGDEFETHSGELRKDDWNSLRGANMARTVMHENDVTRVRRMDHIIGKSHHAHGTGVGGTDGPEEYGVPPSQGELRQAVMDDTIGRAVTYGSFARGFSDHGSGLVQLLDSLRGGWVRRMGVTMASYLVPAGNDHAQQLRMMDGFAPNDKKCGVSVIFFQRIENDGGVSRVGTIVKSQSQEFVGKISDSASNHLSAKLRRDAIGFGVTV